MPIYTAVCYLDNAQIEIVPGTHIDGQYNTYKNKMIINMKPGDLLVFHAGLYHRGLSDGSPNRRILQVFDIFPTLELKNIHNPLFYSVMINNTLVGQIIRNINVKNNISNSFLEKLHYYLISKRMQYSFILNDMPKSFKKDKYITYESSLCSELDMRKLHKWNINIITQKQNYVTPSMAMQNTIIIFFLLYLIVLLWKWKSKWNIASHI